MTRITEKHYREAEARIEELLPLVDEDTPISDSNYIELKRVSDIVEAYETEHYPIGSPTLKDCELTCTLMEERFTFRARSPHIQFLASEPVPPRKDHALFVSFRTH